VTFQLRRGVELHFVRAHLLSSPDGRHWAIPEDLVQPGGQVLDGAYPLDPTLLELLEDNGIDAPVYRYRAVLISDH
jgi:hypothetical protein